MSILRVYDKNTKQSELYKNMYINQTVDYVLNKKNIFKTPFYRKMSIHEALKKLDNFIDPSDPDLNEENSIHAYQTAERIRKKEPYNTELQIVGLIHDLGKVLYEYNIPTWSIVGDTYVVGCEYPKTLVYYDIAKQTKQFKLYENNKYGIYKKNCGISSLHLSYGHDEYLYQVLMYNKDKHNLSQDSLDIIRYHSFYPWHTHNSYSYFMNDKDEITKNNVKHFNEYDLYSKEDTDLILTKDIQNYYSILLNHYFKKELNW